MASQQDEQHVSTAFAAGLVARFFMSSHLPEQSRIISMQSSRMLRSSAMSFLLWWSENPLTHKRTQFACHTPPHYLGRR